MRASILVVDDDPVTLNLLVKILSGEGHQIFPADSGELALGFCASQTPDLILSDVQMPGVDGFELCRRLKVQSQTKDIPFIFISGATQREERVKGLELGAVDFIGLPFQKEDVLARVRIHLEIRQLQKNLEAKSQELRTANEQLQQKNLENQGTIAELRQTQTQHLEALALSHRNGRALLSVMEDQRHTLESLRQSQARYRLLAEHITDVIWTLDPSTGRFTYVSPSVEGLRGYTAEEVLSMPALAALTPEAAQQVTEGLPKRIAAFESGDESLRVRVTELDQPRKDGSIVPTEVVTKLLTDEQGKVREILGVSRDMTVRRQLEADRQHLMNLYATLSQTNQAIVHSASQDELFREVCRICVECGQVDLAWMGIPSRQAGQDIEIVEAFGPLVSYVQDLELSLDPESPFSQGPTGSAILEGRIILCQDWETETRVAPWRERARSFGIRSSASLPIRKGGHWAASLNLYSTQVAFFKADRIELLHEMADDLSHALDNLAKKEALRALLDRTQAIIQNLPGGIVHILDRDFRYVVDAGEGLRKVGLSHEILVGKSIYEVLDPPTAERVAEHYARVLKGETVHFEGEYRGVSFWVSATPLRDARGEIQEILVLSLDISERKQAEQQILAANQRLEGLWRISSLAEADIKLVSDQVLDTIVRMTGSAFGFFGFVHEDESGMTIHAWSGEAMKNCKMVDKPTYFALQEAGVWAEAIRQRKPLILNRYQDHHPAKKGLPHGHVPLSNLLVVPYEHGGRISSVVAVANRAQDFGPEDIQNIKAFFLGVEAFTERKRAEEAQKQQLEELRRWHATTMGRETRILELKREVNELLARLGLPPRYGSVAGKFAEDDQGMQP